MGKHPEMAVHVPLLNFGVSQFVRQHIYACLDRKGNSTHLKFTDCTMGHLLQFLIWAKIRSQKLADGRTKINY